jgi:transcriptional regulator with XRE-family HTH domain
MSQEAFAFEVELDRTYVSGIERGIRNRTVATLIRLTQALGTTPAGLLRATERTAK